MKRNYRLNSRLTKGLEENLKEHVGESFISAHGFLNVLADRLEEKIEEKVKANEAAAAYEKESWALYQADSMGYRRALREVINLFVDNKPKV